MASTTVISGNATKNDNSTIANAGNVQTGFSSVTPANLQAVNGPIKVPGPVMDTTNVGCFPIVSGANHATLVAGAYVGKGYTDTLAGTTATPLSIGGVKDGTGPISIHKTSGIWTTEYVDWSYVSGLPIAPHTSGIFHQMEADKCALITRAVPGSLTYNATGGTPTNDTYDAKTNG